MTKTLSKLLVVLTLFVSAFFPLFAEVNHETTYTVIKGHGTIDDITKTLAVGEQMIVSKDGINAYKVHTIPIRNPQHLLELMGATTEENLTDLQRGLLATYRFSQTQGFTDLEPRIPQITEKISLNLVDIAGYEDSRRFPQVKNDFWPINSRVYHYNGNKYVIHTEIRISGADCLGYGPKAAEQMKGTYAHEFGHSLDLTAIESDGYGYDGTHYINEQIQPKASLAEGFANFIKWLFFDETEKEFREATRTVKIERPEGGYDEYPISTEKLVGEGFLNIEAINTLIFARLASELPNGRKLILDSFEKHNNAENRMSNFLQNFVKDYPAHGSDVARILDRETFGKLSAAEMRMILGKNPGVEEFIATRAINGSDLPLEPTPSVPGYETITHRGGVIYKWKDKQGNWQFTDQPPPADTEYTTRTRSPEPQQGLKIKVKGSNNNPFNVEQ